MIFFNYLFYRLYWWNTKIIKETTVPVFYASIGLATFQGLNFISFYFLFSVYIFNNYNTSKEMTMLLGGIICLFNLLYYGINKRYLKIIKTNEFKSVKEKRKKDFFCILYILFTILLSIFTVVIGHEHNI